MRTVILVDGKNFCFRQGFTQQNLQTSDGHPTGMLYGAVNGMARLARIHPGAAIVFCWDGPQAKESWRHKKSDAYKAHRGRGEMPDFVKKIMVQIPVLEALLSVMGFTQLKVTSLEADDLIGIMAYHVRGFADQVLIYSTDRDFYQLMSKQVKVVRDQDKTKQCLPVTIKDIRAEFCIAPKDWLRYRAIVGDPGDGIIKAVPGVGPKGAVKLLEQGLDASRKDGLPKELKKKIGPYWKHIRLNYRLSKILKEADPKVLNTETVESVNKLLRRIKCFEDLVRTKEGKSKKAYKDLLKFLAEYEMVELMERRAVIWAIP